MVRTKDSEARRARTRGTPTRPSRKKGERRIIVDGVAYYWRIPQRANTNQEDLWMSLFAIVRHAEEPHAELCVFFPQMHGVPGTYRTAEERARRRELQLAKKLSAPPVTPREVAAAVREAVARGWRRDRSFTLFLPGSRFVRQM
jgi:hypothetical protein